MANITVHLLTPDDWQSLLEFELRSRSWFDQFVEPRAESFFSPHGIQQHIANYLAGHAAGHWFPGLLRNNAGTIIGRSNLKHMDVKAGVAELGYRVGHDQVGKGVATAAVTQMKAIARHTWGLQRLNAVVVATNVASVRVLEKSGFVRQDAAQPASALAHTAVPAAAPLGAPSPWDGSSAQRIAYTCPLE